MRRTGRVLLAVLTVCFLYLLPAFAFFSFGDIEGAPGWKFKTLRVREDSVFVTIVNETDDTANFTGRIHFIGFSGDLIAKSRVFRAVFAPRSEKNFTSYLFYQTQSVARSPRVEWAEVSTDIRPAAP